MNAKNESAPSNILTFPGRWQSTEPGSPILPQSKGMSRKAIGDTHEARLAVYLANRGYGVAWPAKVSRYDIIADVFGTLLKLQCKTVTPYYHGGRRYKMVFLSNRPYSFGDNDVYPAYDRDSDSFYFLPELLCVGRKSLAIKSEFDIYREPVFFNCTTIPILTSNYKHKYGYQHQNAA